MGFALNLKYRRIIKMKKITVIGTLLGILTGSIGSGILTTYLNNTSIKEKNEKINKFRSYYEILNRWLILKQEEKSLQKYFLYNGYKNIAIYGMGELGNRLYDELKNSDVKVKYAMDTNYSGEYAELDIKGFEDDLPKVDIIVVTAIFAYDEIENKLRNVVDYKVISLEDVVYDM